MNRNEPVDPLPWAAVQLQLRMRLLSLRQANRDGRGTGPRSRLPGALRRLGWRPVRGRDWRAVHSLGRGPGAALVSRRPGVADATAARPQGGHPDESVVQTRLARRLRPNPTGPVVYVPPGGDD